MQQGGLVPNRLHCNQITRRLQGMSGGGERDRMFKKILTGGFFCLLFAVAAQPLMAQFGQMQGFVRGEDGQPLVNSAIHIDREDIKGHYELKTDKNGKFFHAGLPLGKFSVSVVRDGKKLFSLGGIQTRLSEPAMVEIDLQQERARQEAAAQGVQIPEEQGRLSPEQMEAIAKAAKEQEEQIKKRQALVGKFDEAMTAMKAKDYDTAIPAFQAAAEVDPTQHVVYAQLGEAYSGKAALAKASEEKKEWYGKSVEAYKKSIELKPEDASYHNNFALALANAGNVEEAQAELVKAAELDTVNAGQYYFNLGAVLVNKANMKEAAEAFRKATETSPNFAEAYYQLGVTLIGMATVDPKTGSMVPPEGTKEALEKYMQLAPTGPNAAAAKSLLDMMASSIQTSVGGGSQEQQRNR